MWVCTGARTVTTSSRHHGNEHTRSERRTVTPAVLALLLLLSSCAHPGGGTTSDDYGFSPFGGLLALYRGPLDHLSSVRHGSCPMFPSCSEYSLQALKKHGPTVGWVMSMDRLTRCGRDEVKTAPRVRVKT